MPSSDVLLPAGRFQDARARIAPHIRRTPLAWSPWLSGLAGGEVHLKLESLQLTGSFKLRGAVNAAIARRSGAATGSPTPRLVTASAGNHGRGLAWAARALGLPLVVFTPRDAPAAKRDAIERLGADLRDVAESYDDAERLAKAFAGESGAVYVSPYSDPDVIAGAGTVALELLEDLPGVARVVVPIGGGGLASGIGTVLAHLAPAVDVVGVEVERSHAFTASLAAGRIVEVEVGATLADGLAGNMDPDTITFEMVRRVVHRIVLAGEDDLAAAMRGLALHEHVVAEGAGATAVAAIVAGRLPPPAGPTVCIVSGGNVDPGRLASVLTG